MGELGHVTQYMTRMHRLVFLEAQLQFMSFMGDRRLPGMLMRMGLAAARKFDDAGMAADSLHGQLLNAGFSKQEVRHRSTPANAVLWWHTHMRTAQCRWNSV